MIRIIVVAGVLLISACANTGTSTPAAANKTAVVATVNNLEYLPFKQPVLGKSLELEFDQSTTRYNDGKTKRLVHGIRLPQSNGDLIVTVTTKRVGSAGAPSIFYPEVWVLDSRFQLSRVLPSSNYVFRSGRSGFLEGKFLVKGAKRNESHLVVTIGTVPSPNSRLRRLTKLEPP